MRKYLWGGVAACLVVGIAAYLTVHHPLKPPRPGPAPVQEEQEPPIAPIASVAADPAPNAPAVAESKTSDIVEPIVVEGPAAEPPPAPAFGGAAVAGKAVPVEALAPEPAPRPDAEPGQEKKMPYAEEQAALALGARLWEALCRMLNGCAGAARRRGADGG